MRSCRRVFLSSLVSLSLFLLFSPLTPCLRLSCTRHLHRSGSFYSFPCPPQGLLPISDSGSSADVFAQYFKRLLMEIAIMPSVLPPSASQFFRKAWFSMVAGLFASLSLAINVFYRDTLSGDIRYSAVDISIIVQ